MEFLWNIFQASIILSRNQSPPIYYIQLEIDGLRGAINLERSPKRKKMLRLKTMKMKKLELFNLKNTRLSYLDKNTVV